MPIHPQSAGGTSASNYISQQSIQPQLTGRGTPPSNENLTPKPHTPLENSSGGSPALVSASSTAVPLPQVSTTTLANPKFHVLLVEDDNVCIQLCRKFLVKYGCQVTVATDGLNAISTVEHTKYDLVLMDIVMPNLDGATATSVIRSFDTKTPIIAMTGNIEDNDLVTYLQNGMSDILAKPFTKDDLYSILSKHLLTDETKGSAPRTNGLTLHRRNTSPVTTTDTAETPDGLQSGLTNLQRASQTIVSPTLPTSEDPVLKKQRLQR
jgi:FOG: CheY-like receiver